MKAVFRYRNNALAQIFVPKIPQTKRQNLCEQYNSKQKENTNFMKIGDTSVFHCSDEMDGKQSLCCGAIIRNGFCSDCGENV